MIDLLIAHTAGRPGPGLIEEAFNPARDIPPAPFANRVGRELEPRGDALIRFPGRAGQHDARPRGERIRGGLPARPAFEERAIHGRQHHRREGATSRHSGSWGVAPV